VAVDDHCVTVRLEALDVIQDVVEDAVHVHVVVIVGQVDLATVLMLDVAVCPSQ
jgi:uncharacterized protein (UPF0218 family)